MEKIHDEVPASIVSEATNRGKIIVRTSIIGIIANFVLVVFKATVGIVSNSIAVTLDAVNNLSDALSSIITIIGAKIAGRNPDRKHPLGHGRVEYLSAMIVAALVLYAGITSIVESVKKIITPELADYSTVSLIIIGAAVVVKFFLGQYVKRQGKKVKSAALQASGADALFDAILSLSVLASALIYLIFHISLEAYVGAIISIFIIKSGIEMMIDTLNDILGRRADEAITKEIRRIIMEEPEVRGAYDLLLNNYGPDKNYASVHLELPDTMTVEKVDVLTRRIQTSVYRKTGVILTGVGVYSYNTQSGEATNIRNTVMEAVMAHDWALQFHGFYVDVEQKQLRFDVVMSFDIRPQDGLKTLYQEIGALYPDYHIDIVPDVDISD